MQKGWEKLPLPVNLNTNSGNSPEKLEQNWSKQPPFASVSLASASGLPSVASPPTKVSSPSASGLLPSAGQQVPVSPLQWSPELRSAYQTAWNMTVQELNGLISPEYYFSGSMPDDPAQAQSILNQVKLLFDAVNIARRISDQIPDVIALAKGMGLEHLTAQIYG
jgi:hypothetical protein